MRKRRRLYRYTVGVLSHDRQNEDTPWEWTLAKLKRVLNDKGFKTSIQSVGIPILLNIFHDAHSGGFRKTENFNDIVGKSFSQTGKIEVYAYPEDEEFIKIIIRGCYCMLIPELSDKQKELLQTNI